MESWKWVWNWTTNLAIPSLWGFGALMVSEKSFTAAEWLFIIGNILCAIKIIGAPQIDRGQRVAIITFVILMAIGLSFSQWLWVEGRRSAALVAEIPVNVEIASSGNGGGTATVPTNPRVSLPSTVPASPPGSSPGKSGKVKPAAVKTTAKPAQPPLKIRVGQLSNYLYNWMLDKENARPEVWTVNAPDVSQQARQTMVEDQTRVKMEWQRQTLNEYHEKFEGRLMVVKTDLKNCGYNVESLGNKIPLGAPFAEINFGVVLGTINELSEFSQKLPDKDSDLSCKN